MVNLTFEGRTAKVRGRVVWSQPIGSGINARFRYGVRFLDLGFNAGQTVRQMAIEFQRDELTNRNEETVQEPQGFVTEQSMKESG